MVPASIRGTMVVATMDNPTLHAALERSFGFTGFREGQEEILSAVLDGKDCVAVLPTGGGKSLCFQLPAAVREGLTLVVSPLIALMKDQVDSLAQTGLPATFINSSLGWNEMQKRLGQMARGAYRLVYVAPERFRSERFLDALSSAQVDLFAVDEAHCISMWGHDFRPDYMRLRTALEQLKNPQVIALTATATPEVRDDIVKQLGLGQPPRIEPQVVVSGFARPGLTLAVRRVSSHAEKLERTLEILRNFPTGIVYCSTRANTEKVAARLQAAGISCIRYHAGMSDSDRKKVQGRFLDGEVPVAVATNAFGMGIDRADLRTIIHWDIPGSIEAYYQEAGRAGRDGKPSRCELLFSFADVRTQKFFIEGANPPGWLVKAVARAVIELCEKQPAAVNPGMLAGRLDREANPMAIETSLGLLERAGLISVVPSPEPELKVIAMQDPEADLNVVTAPLREKAERDHSRLRRLLRYVESRTCRHATILRYFGDPAHREMAHCRQCDNCQQKPEDADLRPPDEEEWVEIQKVLSCVARLHGRFGRARICQVLAGSRDKAVLAVGLEKLPTYAALAGRPQSYIRDLIDALTDRDCIKTVGDEYPTLKITPYGREVMHRRQEIELVWPKRLEPKRKVAAEVIVSEGPADPGLVDALRALRTRLARERKIPPYLILHNKTLEEIARRAPRDPAGLLEVPGIGPGKLADIGEEILAVIRETTRRP